MSADLDRFDRMLLGVAPASPTRATFRTTATSFVARATTPAPVHAVPPVAQLERQPVITSKRPPRFVDHTTCPMCGTAGQGIEFHGTLMSGAKVHQIAAHTANMRRVDRSQPRCLGSGMRIVFEGGVWKGAPAP